MNNSELIWRPMETAPRDGRCIVVKWANSGAVVVRWDNDGWWIEDKELDRRSGQYYDEMFSGWSPIPPLES